MLIMYFFSASLYSGAMAAYVHEVWLHIHVLVDQARSRTTHSACPDHLDLIMQCVLQGSIVDDMFDFAGLPGLRIRPQ